MSVILRRRPDGIVQIRPRPLWRAIAGPVPAVILALLAGCATALALLAVALVRVPALVLLLAGSAMLGLVAVRWALVEPSLVEARRDRNPPGDAA